MINCRASSWRCIRPLSSSFLPPVHPFRRNLSSSLALPDRPKSRDDPWKFSLEALQQRRKAKAALTSIPEFQDDKKQAAGEMWLGKRDSRIPLAEWNARKKELQWLRDPLEVADFVKNELNKDKAQEMLQLVRMASHSMQCTVSWNHIINYHLTKGNLSLAFKIYTEMKKRAQFPDSYTYTILLRGLSNNAHLSGVTARAMTVYLSMSAPNSRVEPTIIHTNAALRVCARTLDMDALWTVVAKIPQNGPGAADEITYTTILNAIKQSLLVDVPKDESAEETAARRDTGVVEGRRIWEEIIQKWRNADLVVEEGLVCSMARLLLVGSRPQDWDDVLSLIEQTMDIPRFVPRLGSEARAIEGVPRLRAPYTPKDYKMDDDRLTPEGEHKRGDEFLAIVPRGSEKSSLAYATPGNNTLSVVMEACQRILALKAAEKYWHTITDPTTYNVIPDVNNLNFRLRGFRQARASTAALKSIREDFLAKNLRPPLSTFRIAMSTCVRDKNNHNSLRNANEVLALMHSCLNDADAVVVTMYAKLAISFPLAKADDLVESLTALQPVIQSLRLQCTVGAEDPKDRKGAVPLSSYRHRDSIQALQSIYGIYDKLLMSNIVEKSRQAPFIGERSRLAAFLARMSFKGDSSKENKTAAQDVLDSYQSSSGDAGQRRKGSGWRESRARPEENRRPWSSN